MIFALARTVVGHRLTNIKGHWGFNLPEPVLAESRHHGRHDASYVMGHLRRPGLYRHRDPLGVENCQEQRAGRFDSLIARVNRAQSLALFRAVAIARWTCIGVLAVAVVDLIRLFTFDHI